MHKHGRRRDYRFDFFVRLFWCYVTLHWADRAATGVTQINHDESADGDVRLFVLERKCVRPYAL